MRVILSALGSFGDVYPIVGLASRLRERGHDVSVIANPYFETVVASQHLEFVPLATREHYLNLARHPDLWRPLAGLRVVLGLAVEFAGPIYEAIVARHEPGNTVVGAHGLDLGSRIAEETHGIPFANLHLAPLPLRTMHEGPAMPFGSLSRGVPGWLKRCVYSLADSWVIDPIVARPLNDFRRQLGLAPVRRVYADWWLSSRLGLALFPDWFGPPQPDWPTATTCVGFPLWDEGGDQRLPPDAARWIDDGEPPIVFTPGSAMTEGYEFFSAAVSACERLGRRGILLTRFAEQVPSQLPPTVCHFDYLPFSQLLRRAAAVVHHGGIGSCASGLASGVPQLVMPMAFDQFDNAARLERLGVATSVPRRRFNANTAMAGLERLLGDRDVGHNCRRRADECDGRQAVDKAAVLMERLLSEPLR